MLEIPRSLNIQHRDYAKVLHVEIIALCYNEQVSYVDL